MIFEGNHSSFWGDRTLKTQRKVRDPFLKNSLKKKDWRKERIFAHTTFISHFYITLEVLTNATKQG